MRLPRRIVFPFGYVVEVREVSDAEIREENDGDIVDGLWDAETRTVYVRASIPLKRRRYILWHEMGHVLWDGQHDLLDEGAMNP